MSKCEFSFDSKCLDLARHFYPNALELDLWGLAQRLQDVVEAEDIENPTPETAAGDGKLWAIHVPGPDDVWACESKEAAEQRAKGHNEAIDSLGLAARFGLPETAVQACVIEWPHSAASHAESLRDGVADSLQETGALCPHGKPVDDTEHQCRKCGPVESG